MNIDCDPHTVQIVALGGLTALGAIAIIYDGSIGETIAIAVAGALGYLARTLFPGGKQDAEEVQE